MIDDSKLFFDGEVVVVVRGAVAIELVLHCGDFDCSVWPAVFGGVVGWDVGQVYRSVRTTTPSTQPLADQTKEKRHGCGPVGGLRSTLHKLPA